jgi:hypothetical protein
VIVQVYDTYIDIVENLDTKISKMDEDTKQALEAAADSLSFAQGLNDMFIAHGISLPETPDLYKLEGVIEGYVGELIAAVMLLSNYQLGDTPAALEKLNKAIDGKFPASVVTGCLRLADRIKQTRVSQQKLVTGEKTA